MAYNQNNLQRGNERVRFDLREHIGVLSMKDTGWNREVNIVSWNGGDPKVDVREWAPDHKRMGKGITLYEEEAETLVRMLARRYGIRVAEREPVRRTFMTEENSSCIETPSVHNVDQNAQGVVDSTEINSI